MKDFEAVLSDGKKRNMKQEKERKREEEKGKKEQNDYGGKAAEERERKEEKERRRSERKRQRKATSSSVYLPAQKLLRHLLCIDADVSRLQRHLPTERETHRQVSLHPRRRRGMKAAVTERQDVYLLSSIHRSGKHGNKIEKNSHRNPSVHLLDRTRQEKAS